MNITITVRSNKWFGGKPQLDITIEGVSNTTELNQAILSINQLKNERFATEFFKEVDSVETETIYSKLRKFAGFGKKHAQ